MNYKNIPSFCINLDRRTDRWQSVFQEIKKVNNNISRISAVEGADAEGHLSQTQTSVLKSHRNVWKIICENKIKSCFVFEDDIVFSTDFKDVIEKAIEELPKNWEILHLHSCHAKVEKRKTYTNTIVNDLWGAHGYLLTEEGAKRLLNTWGVIDFALSEDFTNKGGVPYGMKKDWTLCFQDGKDSDCPETAALGWWKNFYRRNYR